jgi:hypothetical protein
MIPVDCLGAGRQARSGPCSGSLVERGRHSRTAGASRCAPAVVDNQSVGERTLYGRSVGRSDECINARTKFVAAAYQQHQLPQSADPHATGMQAGRLALYVREFTYFQSAVFSAAAIRWLSLITYSFSFRSLYRITFTVRIHYEALTST